MSVPGNRNAVKYEEEDAIKIFEGIREKAIEGKYNSMQGAILDNGFYNSGFYHLIDRFPVLESIKKDIEQIVISTVNDKAIDGKGNPAACIWRMKQLGEKDESHTNNQHNVTGFNVGFGK